MWTACEVELPGSRLPATPPTGALTSVHACETYDRIYRLKSVRLRTDADVLRPRMISGAKCLNERGHAASQGLVTSDRAVCTEHFNKRR